jgi:hypothetical protein
MTLCLAWKASSGQIHLAADSRVNLGATVPADVAVKVASLPFRIADVPTAGNPPLVILEGEIGLTYCGSAVSMFAVKESISEVLLHMQCIDKNTVSLNGICEIIFATYQQILPQVIDAMLSSKAVTNIIVVGYCPTNRCEEAYLIETDSMNVSSMHQILIGSKQQHVILGTGATSAHNLLASIASPVTDDYLNTLQSVIDDPAVPTVGGHLVYGHTDSLKFKTFGLCVTDHDGVGYWRAGLDFNAPVYQTVNQSGLHVNYPMLTR